MQDNKIKIVHTFVEFCGCGCGDGASVTKVFVNKTLVKSSRKRKFFVSRSRRLGAKNMTFDFASLEFFD